MIKINMLGRTFGDWEVIGLAPSSNKGQAKWLCRCTCGVERIVWGGPLRFGSTQGCGCRNVRKRPFEAIYNHLLRTAARKRHAVDLTFEEFVQFTQVRECAYCSATVNWYKHVRNYAPYNLDRKNNAIGYTKENCVVCCARCNDTKSCRLTYEEMLAVGQIRRRAK